MATRTITLSGRPPVRINEDNWPLIASAKDFEHDGQVECQANRRSNWFVGVRHGPFNRFLVYATYSYRSNYQGARDYSAKRGILVDNASHPDERAMSHVVAAIREVCEDIAQAECSEGDADRWTTLAAECIADLPAEDLDGGESEAPNA